MFLHSSVSLPLLTPPWSQGQEWTAVSRVGLLLGQTDNALVSTDYNHSPHPHHHPDCVLSPPLFLPSTLLSIILSSFLSSPSSPL